MELEMDYITLQIEKDLKDRFEKKMKDEERTISAGIRLLIKQNLGEEDAELNTKEAMG